MVEKLVLLVVGFVLTTIAGGLVAAVLQHRSWRYRWDTENLEKNVSTSRELFQEISRLMDRRLYRVDQFYLWSKRQSEAELLLSLENYRSAVVDWNDNINRHLSLLQIFFGKEIREKFDYEVGAKFRTVGTLVEDFYRHRGKQDETLTASIERGIKELREDVYQYNLLMLGAIENKTKQAAVYPRIIDDLKRLF